VTDTMAEDVGLPGDIERADDGRRACACRVVGRRQHGEALQCLQTPVVDNRHNLTEFALSGEAGWVLHNAEVEGPVIRLTGGIAHRGWPQRESSAGVIGHRSGLSSGR
jgi:hypothetical protein